MSNVETIRNENNRLSKKLNQENQGIYTDIVCYLRVSDLSEMEQEEVFGDILRMFFDWQKQNKKVKDMIGENYKKFADDIIAAVNPHKSILQKIKEYLIILIQGICYLLTIDFVFIYIPKIIKGNLSLVYDYSLDMALRGLLIVVAAICIITYIGKNSFRLSKKRTPKPVRFIIGGCAGLFIVLLILLSKALRDIILVSVDICYIITTITVFWTYKIFQKIAFKKKLSGE